MRIQLTRMLVTVVGLAAVALPTHAIAEDRPQEVLDLIAGHQALAMKIRALQDRVTIAAASEDRDGRFNSEAAPVRAKVKATTEESTSDAENRVPERLRHKDRAASDSDDDDRSKPRLAALDKSARTERERVNRPQYGVGLSKRHKDIISAQKQLSVLQREFAALEREINAPKR